MAIPKLENEGGNIPAVNKLIDQVNLIVDYNETQDNNGMQVAQVASNRKIALKQGGVAGQFTAQVDFKGHHVGNGQIVYLENSLYLQYLNVGDYLSGPGVAGNLADWAIIENIDYGVNAIFLDKPITSATNAVVDLTVYLNIIDGTNLTQDLAKLTNKILLIKDQTNTTATDPSVGCDPKNNGLFGITSIAPLTIVRMASYVTEDEIYRTAVYVIGGANPSAVNMNTVWSPTIPVGYRANIDPITFDSDNRKDLLVVNNLSCDTIEFSHLEIVSSNSTYQMVKGSPTVITIKGTNFHTIQGYDAQTVTGNRWYVFDNSSTKTVVVNNFSGSLQFQIPPKVSVFFIILQNGTQNGVFKVVNFSSVSPQKLTGVQTDENRRINVWGDVKLHERFSVVGGGLLLMTKESSGHIIAYGDGSETAGVDELNIQDIDATTVPIGHSFYYFNDAKTDVFLLKNTSNTVIYTLKPNNYLLRILIDNTTADGQWVQIPMGSSGGSGSVTGLAGDVAGSGTGTITTTIQPNVVDNTKLAQMPAKTVKANDTNASANASDVAMKTAFNVDFESDTANIKENGTADLGTSGKVAHSDHVHPSDSTKISVVEDAVDNNIPFFSNGSIADSGVGIGDDGTNATVPTSAAMQNAINTLYAGLSLPDVAAISTTNIANLTGLITVDGYTLQNSDIVLLAGQTAAGNNGAWRANASTWVRQAYNTVSKTWVDVSSQTTYAELNIHNGASVVLNGTINKSLVYRISVSNTTAVFGSAIVRVINNNIRSVPDTFYRYVNTSIGSDANNGSKASPFATISRGLTSAQFPLTIEYLGQNIVYNFTHTSAQNNLTIYSAFTAPYGIKSTWAGTITTSSGSKNLRISNFNISSASATCLTFSSGDLGMHVFENCAFTTTNPTLFSFGTTVSGVYYFIKCDFGNSPTSSIVLPALSAGKTATLRFESCLGVINITDTATGGWTIYHDAGTVINFVNGHQNATIVQMTSSPSLNCLGVIKTQTELNNLLTNTANATNGLYLISGFTPSGSTYKKGDVFYHIVSSSIVLGNPVLYCFSANQLQFVNVLNVGIYTRGTNDFTLNQGMRSQSITTSTNLVPNTNYNCSFTAAVTLTLPLSANIMDGAQIIVQDASGNFAGISVVVDGNGARINGLSSYTANNNYGCWSFVYNQGSNMWSMISSKDTSTATSPGYNQVRQLSAAALICLPSQGIRVNTQDTTVTNANDGWNSATGMFTANNAGIRQMGLSSILRSSGTLTSGGDLGKSIELRVIKNGKVLPWSAPIAYQGGYPFVFNATSPLVDTAAGDTYGLCIDSIMTTLPLTPVGVGSGGTTPTIDGSITDPFGGNNSIKGTFRAKTSTGYDFYYGIGGLTAGITYALKMWVRLGTATKFTVVLNNASAWNTMNVYDKVWTSANGLSTSGWVEVTQTFVAPASGSVNFHFGNGEESGTGEAATNPQDAGTVYYFSPRILTSYTLDAGKTILWANKSSSKP